MSRAVSSAHRREWLRDPRQIPVAELEGFDRGLAIVVRNWYWARTHGFADLLEEHDLNPLVRLPRDARKLAWRVSRRTEPGRAQPVLLLGAQRSGTNMVTYGLAMAPQVQVHNEGDRRAFERYRLRPPEVLARIVGSSRHEFVLFKPLEDSHRAVELLDEVGWNRPARALWVYREVDGRARSAVAKFGDSNLRVLKKRAASPGFRSWQLDGLSPESAALLDSFDPGCLSALDGAALFWLVRNRIFFEHGLDRREDVLLVSYDRFIADPAPVMARICEFLGIPFTEALISHVERRASRASQISEISPPIHELCDQLRLRLDAVAEVSA
ncbi:MAG TPA: sulfotransferase domain-containing protein [Acidimicrobiia bacterium]